MDIAQKTHIGVRDELWNFTGVIPIGQGVGSWSVAGVDYDGKIDVGMGRYPGGVLATVDLRLLFSIVLSLCCILRG